MKNYKFWNLKFGFRHSWYVFNTSFSPNATILRGILLFLYKSVWSNFNSRAKLKANNSILFWYFWPHLSRFPQNILLANTQTITKFQGRNRGAHANTGHPLTRTRTIQFEYICTDGGLFVRLGKQERLCRLHILAAANSPRCQGSRRVYYYY